MSNSSPRQFSSEWASRGFLNPSASGLRGTSRDACHLVLAYPEAKARRSRKPYSASFHDHRISRLPAAYKSQRALSTSNTNQPPPSPSGLAQKTCLSSLELIIQASILSAPQSKVINTNYICQSWRRVTLTQKLMILSSPPNQSLTTDANIVLKLRYQSSPLFC